MMIITCKSNLENFKKEKNGCKPNTVRFLDGTDTIKIINTETNEIMERRITDITIYKGAIIISWNPCR
jgi:hypothetical protein